MKKERLDKTLVIRELVETRSKAAALIMAGQVFVNDQRVDKAGTKVTEEDSIELKGQQNPYASRGGLKLAGAIETFGYDCTDKIVIDVGASTGGFTDCVLQHGAEKVYAIDVGYGQLAWKLQTDERVISMERTNIRHLEESEVPEKCHLAVIDCSFISLSKVLPNTLTFLAPEADIIALVKPQFEVGRENIGKGGVVRDQEARQGAIDGVVKYAGSLGFELVQGADSEVHGPAGNIEYLVWLQRRIEQ